MLVLTLLSIFVVAICQGAFAMENQPQARGLQVRQVGYIFNQSDIPTQCESKCNGTVLSPALGNNCTAITCLCNAGFQACMACAIALGPPNGADSPQDEMDNYESSCSSLGITLPSVTISAVIAAESAANAANFAQLHGPPALRSVGLISSFVVAGLAGGLATVLGL